MAGLKAWIGKKENKILSLKLILAFCFPLLLCIFYCLREGAWITELHLGSSQNNDTLFYYKQVEGMVKYGVPQGYFGFNESSAQIFSFAAWSPFVLLPWALWGKLFGWTVWSPFVCNIFIFAVVLALLVYWMRPDWKQMAVTAGMVAMFPSVTRYLMSCLAETIIVSGVLLFYGLALGFVHKESKGKLVGMFVVASYLTWIRPYLVLLLLLPGAFLFMKKRRMGFFVTIGTMVVNLCVYFAISKWFTADYFQELYNWNLFTGFQEYGIKEWTSILFSYIWNLLKSLAYNMKLSLTEGIFLGSNYCVLFFLLVFASVLAWECYRRNKDKKYFCVVIHYLVTSAISVAALLILMQKINETSRHIMSFVLVGMFLLGCVSEVKVKNFWRPLLVGLLCVYLYHIFPDDGQDYQVPIMQQEKYEEEMKWKELSSNLELNIDGKPSFENTVIWVYSDTIAGGTRRMSWQHMLTLPEGVGISCCGSDYLINNWEDLKSRYISTSTEGTIAQMCEEAGYEKVGETNENVIYKRY